MLFANVRMSRGDCLWMNSTAVTICLTETRLFCISCAISLVLEYSITSLSFRRALCHLSNDVTCVRTEDAVRRNVIPAFHRSWNIALAQLAAIEPRRISGILKHYLLANLPQATYGVWPRQRCVNTNTVSLTASSIPYAKFHSGGQISRPSLLSRPLLFYPPFHSCPLSPVLVPPSIQFGGRGAL